MNFSLDTNIVIGLINNKDRLHDKSINLIKDRQTDHLILCSAAISESQTILRTKINEIMVETIQYLPSFLELSKAGSVDLHSLILEKFKQIREAKPNLKNFLDLVHEEIIIFLKDNRIEKLPSFLSQFSIRYSRHAIPTRLQEMHSIFKIIEINKDTLSDVKKSLIEIDFKDTNDLLIFQEIMTNLNDIKPIEFFSNDEEFSKKSTLGYSEIVKNLISDKQAFNFILL